MRAARSAKTARWTGGVVEAGEFQSGIKTRLCAAIFGEGVSVAGLEVRTDGGAAFRVVDLNKTPRLAVADGRRHGGEGEQFIEGLIGDRIAAEAAHMAALTQQLLEAIAEGIAELRGRDRGIGHDGVNLAAPTRADNCRAGHTLGRRGREPAGQVASTRSSPDGRSYHRR